MARPLWTGAHAVVFPGHSRFSGQPRMSRQLLSAITDRSHAYQHASLATMQAGEAGAGNHPGRRLPSGDQGLTGQPRGQAAGQQWYGGGSLQHSRGVKRGRGGGEREGGRARRVGVVSIDEAMEWSGRAATARERVLQRLQAADRAVAIACSLLKVSGSPACQFLPGELLQLSCLQQMRHGAVQAPAMMNCHTCV